MKALVLQGSEILTIQDLPQPQPQAHEVLVRVELAGLGGSEYLGYRQPGIRPLPAIMGHGFSGTLENGGRVVVDPLIGCQQCESCADGQYPLCDAWSLIGVQSPGGFAQYVAVPEANIVPLPEDMTWEQSAFVEPFANSVNAWVRSGAGPESAVAIVGAGGLGLGLVACAANVGSRTIHVVEPSDERCRAASALGATQVGTRTEGRFDVVFDTVGSAEARELALKATRKGGTCVFLGFAEKLQSIDFAAFIREQKQLVGSFVFSRSQFERALQLARLTRAEWVNNLEFGQVEPRLAAYLSGDFRDVKSVLRPQA